MLAGITFLFSLAEKSLWYKDTIPINLLGIGGIHINDDEDVFLLGNSQPWL